MRMRKVLHLIDDIDRIPDLKKKLWREITEDHVHASIQRLKEYIKKGKERINTVASYSNCNISTNIGK